MGWGEGINSQTAKFVLYVSPSLSPSVKTKCCHKAMKLILKADNVLNPTHCSKVLSHGSFITHKNSLKTYIPRSLSKPVSFAKAVREPVLHPLPTPLICILRVSVSRNTKRQAAWHYVGRQLACPPPSSEDNTGKAKNKSQIPIQHGSSWSNTCLLTW